MGAMFSGLTPEDIKDIHKKGCQFNASEIKNLYKRFKFLDKDEIGRIYIDTLLCIPEISINPLGERVIRAICSKDGSLDFKGFLRVLEMFIKTPEIAPAQSRASLKYSKTIPLPKESECSSSEYTAAESDLYTGPSKNTNFLELLTRVISPTGQIRKSDLEEIANDIYGGLYDKEDIQASIEDIFRKYDLDHKEYIDTKDIRDVDLHTLVSNLMQK
ncbi:hypothetical protein NEDG_01270 [Nematocida displodere]|uniref:Calcineurin subunit B n=1 Tax=Nematocida displodere TaxID=1805483 RepID=A0A177EB81_9MICR|nr:hypothetical protein NEDG_01270 [Nematocida displodere]